MMADYPHRPIRKSRPKSSEHIAGRRKTWLSERTTVVQGLDVSPRIGLPWWKSPMMKEARLKKAFKMRHG